MIHNRGDEVLANYSAPLDEGNSYTKLSTKTNFAVLQSLADIQPDVDAVYRMIRDTPFSFVRPEPIPAPVVEKGA